jgi:hypothetical protein
MESVQLGLSAREIHQGAEDVFDSRQAFQEFAWDTEGGRSFDKQAVGDGGCHG